MHGENLKLQNIKFAKTSDIPMKGVPLVDDSLLNP